MITSVGHVAYGVRDIESSLHFYVEQLGMQEAFRMTHDDGSLWIVYLGVGNGTFVELFPEDDVCDADESASYKHLCLHVNDMQSTLSTLAERGIQPLDPPRTGKDGNTQAWLRDPDGNPIELMEIAPDSRQGGFLRQASQAG